jgi:hypothetical protein
MVYDVRRKPYPNHRAWLDGVEVTKRCFYADPRRGVVRVFRLNAQGQKFVDHSQVTYWGVTKERPCVASEELRGRVVVRRAA